MPANYFFCLLPHNYCCIDLCIPTSRNTNTNAYWYYQTCSEFHCVMFLKAFFRDISVMFVLLNTSSLQRALLGPDGPWRAFGPQFYWKSSKYGKKANDGNNFSGSYLPYSISTYIRYSLRTLVHA